MYDGDVARHAGSEYYHRRSVSDPTELSRSSFYLLVILL